MDKSELPHSVLDGRNAGFNQITEFHQESVQGAIKASPPRTFLQAPLGSLAREKINWGIRSKKIALKDEASKHIYHPDSRLVKALNGWMDEVVQKHKDRRVSCISLPPLFRDYFPAEFLENSYYVFVDEIPMPLGDSLKEAYDLFRQVESIEGMAIKNTYFIKRGCESVMSHHFHELIHICQWQILGDEEFISRHLTELNTCGYKDSPLESMARLLESRFSNKEVISDLVRLVRIELERQE